MSETTWVVLADVAPALGNRVDQALVPEYGQRASPASLRFAPGRPLTASFPCKIRHLPGGRGKPSRISPACSGGYRVTDSGTQQ
jgi:hypothetical protein